jgi:microcystin-dependent protein
MNSDTSYNYSTAIGYNSVCTSQNQLMLGTSSDSVVVPGNLSVTGSINNISSDIFSKIQYLSTVSSNVQTQISNVANNKTFNSGLTASDITFTGSINNISSDIFSKIQYLNTVSSNIQTQISNVANNKTFNSGLTASDITFTGSINNISNTVFGYISNASSNIQSQINSVSSNLANVANNPTPSTLSVSGLSTLAQVKVTTSLQVLQNISFSGTLNNISTNTFSYLSGLTNNIQNQINAIANRTPVGSVIQFAGIDTDITGYLPCDGTQYFSYEFPALFNVIQYTYGGDESQGIFKIPNYNGIYLRGAGSQAVNLRVIPGRTPVQKTYSSASMGTVVPHENEEIITANYIYQINQEVKSFITSPNGFGPPGYSFNYSNAVASLNYDTSHDTINPGYTETFPVYTSIKYFIKY